MGEANERAWILSDNLKDTSVSESYCSNPEYPILMKSRKNDNECYKKKYIFLNTKKVNTVITEILIGVGSTITSSTLSITNPSVSIVLSSSAVLLTSIAMLVTNEYISISKIGYKN